jgi:small subunit ribosomal protein S17
MDKTVVVEIEVIKRHPIYHRNIRRTSRLKAHDATNECREGDLVRIESTRPLSKEKHWRVVEVLQRGHELAPIE